MLKNREQSRNWEMEISKSATLVVYKGKEETNKCEIEQKSVPKKRVQSAKVERKVKLERQVSEKQLYRGGKSNYLDAEKRQAHSIMRAVSASQKRIKQDCLTYAELRERYGDSCTRPQTATSRKRSVAGGHGSTAEFPNFTDVVNPYDRKVKSVLQEVTSRKYQLSLKVRQFCQDLDNNNPHSLLYKKQQSPQHVFQTRNFYRLIPIQNFEIVFFDSTSCC
ncbi:hypothetical protein Ciccas_013999 [Cichlidogyrus casuarinus]|uniref:Uncharacterized protein n=1 Tax=Cichlidogyrus casuarinus TaxID=1844966 RepID=A0ABD2PJ82_9PLAT